MCTVTYYPLPLGYILTSSRDENPNRETISPAFYIRGDQTLSFPKDGLKNGTWIAINETGKVSCLLNGANENHKKAKSYKKSRGEIVLESFDHVTFGDFYKTVNFSNVEPFTLVMIDPNLQNQLTVLVWDGKEKIVETSNTAVPKIFSSSTLYDKAHKIQRKKWFDSWLQKQNYNIVDHLYLFHQSKHGKDPENDIVMQRANTQTVSIVQVHHEADKTRFRYEDLIKNTERKFEIKAIKLNK